MHLELAPSQACGTEPSNHHCSTVVYDYIRQPDYDLKQLMAGVNQLSAEYEEVKAEAREARKRRRLELEAELDALESN